MNKAQQSRYKSLYQQHISALTRQGKARVTIDSYARAVRRITEFFDMCPDRLKGEHLKLYFDSLIKSHSWSTVKIDRNGLQFFFHHVLGKEWEWVDIIKPPKRQSLPDILTKTEVESVINATCELRYQVFILTTYSMGLRLSETLKLTVKDIDSERMKVHIRYAKGNKDRFVTLPNRTLQALRYYWSTHRHPTFLFPGGRSESERKHAKKTMDKGGTQRSFKTIVQSCGIHKAITVHSLRHCYGTHMIEAGINLRSVQKELGHACPKTTARYTQFTDSIDDHACDKLNQMIDGLSITWGDQ